MIKNTFVVFVFLLISNIIFSQDTPTNLEEYFKVKNIAPKNFQDAFYNIEKQGNGATPKRGDYVKIKYVGKLLDGTVFDESGEESFVFRLGYREVIQGWEIGIPMFKVGSKGSLFLPPNLAYGSRSLGEIPANASLIFDIEVQAILNEAEYEKYNDELENKEKIAFEKQKKLQFEKDNKLIADYIAAKKLKTTASASGLHYVITKKGKGETAKSGNLVVVEYEGTLLDGSSFDSTKGREPFQFVLGAKKVLEGWEEGFQHFSKGSEGILIIPSHLAYKGTAIADKNIPSFAVLVFKIKVKDIK